MKKLTILLMIAVAAVFVAALPGSTAKSNIPCSQCHSDGRYVYIDILEADNATSIPASIGVGETKTVTVVLQEQSNAPRNTGLTGVTLTLSSQAGHFAVSQPIFSVGNMQPGTATATWQITGVSPGSDTLLISAHATTVHNRLTLTDSSSPSPAVTVSGGAQQTYTVSVAVTDSGTGSALEGVTVAIGGITRSTDAGGAASFSVPAGSYSLDISNVGYTPISETIQVTGDMSLSRALTPSAPAPVVTPMEPATDFTPLIAVLRPLAIVVSYALTFAFAAYDVGVGKPTVGLKRIGYVALGATVLAVTIGALGGRAIGSGSLDWTALPFVVSGVGASILAFSFGRMGVSRLLAVASCVPAFLALPYQFGLAGAALLAVVYAVRTDVPPDRSPEAMLRKKKVIEVNRTFAWLFISVAAANIALGYAFVRFGLMTDILRPLHEAIGFVFAGLLTAHVSLGIRSGYSWGNILRNGVQKRNAFFGALLVQELTALGLLAVASFKVLTGVGWVSADVASLIPRLFHVQSDQLLLMLLGVHGLVGLRAGLTRRKARVPGGDKTFVAVAIALIVAVFLLNV